jgi:pimeloyl-ACP methyl ester carboxylesterase
MKEKIFFAHANGFPAEVYGDLFSRIPNYEIDYIPLLAHGNYRVKYSWSDVVPEIIAYFEENYTEPVWAIGHSFGAVCLALAAQQKPELFKGIIMMDPPALSKKIRCILAVSQCFGVSKYIMPLAKKSAKRSDHFPDREFVASKLRTKFLFKNFGEQSFQNYIKYGFTDLKEGITLRFKKEVETKIFALTPPFYRKITLNIPSFYLYATEGTIAVTRSIDKVEPLFTNTTFIAFNGGHLFPLEQTEKCANELLNILNSKN